MEQVWIVHHDSGPDNNILGVFDNEQDAEEFVAVVGPQFERGVLTSCLPVPWRSTDRVSDVRIKRESDSRPAGLHTGESLDENARNLIAVVSQRLGAEGAALRQHASVARISAYTPTMIDVVVPSGQPRIDLPDRPTPGRHLVIRDGELAGEILLWVRDGKLTGLEQAWHTDDAPIAWPRPTEIEFRET